MPNSLKAIVDKVDSLNLNSKLNKLGLALGFLLMAGGLNDEYWW